MVEVFKTSVQEAGQANVLVQKLLEHFPSSQINFDLEDCDKVLRVEGKNISPEKIINLLNSDCYQCELLF